MNFEQLFASRGPYQEALAAQSVVSTSLVREAVEMGPLAEVRPLC